MIPAVQYLSQCSNFFLATAEGDQPTLRPFGAIAEIEGKAYLCTNNTKNVYKQLLKNPKLQLVGLREDRTWVRVTGKAVPDHRREAREAFLEIHPAIRNMYHPDDQLFEVFYIEDPVTELATFHVNGYIMNRIEA